MFTGLSGQMSAVAPKGVKKKKFQYAPYIEEQAKQGVATNLVMGQKEKQRYEEEKAFQEKEFAAQQTQWQTQMEQQRKEFEQKKKQNDIQNMLGGLSTFATIGEVLGWF
jgi:phage-related minor tail protein